MAYLYYSTWMLAEHLRLWNDQTLRSWLWWSRADREAGRWPAVVPASEPTPRAPGSGPPPDRPPDGYFERLVTAVERIARHAFYPGKPQAVEHCLEEVEDLRALGRITTDQAAFLVNLLSGACPQAA